MALKKLYCDVDNTINHSWKRVRRWTKDGVCDFSKAHTREEVMKDEVLPGAKEALEKLSERYEIIFLTARSYKDAYNITKDWLDEQGFNYSSIIVVKNPMEKLAYVRESDCLFIDDLSRGHEVNPPYKVLYWYVIRELNSYNVEYEIFNDNWEEIVERRIT